jgi:hypothetical protein
LLFQLLSTYHPNLAATTVTVVDNYQGQENVIVVLSLVRSGDDGIGFLADTSRVCVALSRAKWGFYAVGNLTVLARKSEIWMKVRSCLDAAGRCGEALPMVCPRHEHSSGEWKYWELYLTAIILIGLGGLVKLRFVFDINYLFDKKKVKLFFTGFFSSAKKSSFYYECARGEGVGVHELHECPSTPAPRVHS